MKLINKTQDDQYGKWFVVGVPHKGWSCVEVIDLEDHSAVCEMCETACIRRVHIMQHPVYPLRLRCGAKCAHRMERRAANTL